MTFAKRTFAPLVIAFLMVAMTVAVTAGNALRVLQSLCLWMPGFVGRPFNRAVGEVAGVGHRSAMFIAALAGETFTWAKE